jgi:serine/threonine protein kinase
VYTLGVTLYQAVTGVLPFEKKTDYEYMNAHLHEQPLPPTALQPAIPQELEDIILKAIDKDPDNRFQSAHEFRKALLKVGMVHVRAYRRLKAIRREKDKAALSLSPTWRREEEVASYADQLRSSLESLFAKKTNVAVVVAAVAVLGIATTLWLRPANEAPLPVAQNNIEQPAVVSAAEPSTPTAPEVIAAPATAPVATATASSSTAAAPLAKTPAATPVKTDTARKGPVRRPRQTTVKNVDNNKTEDKKYDALKKAWGG